MSLESNKCVALTDGSLSFSTVHRTKVCTNPNFVAHLKSWVAMQTPRLMYEYRDHHGSTALHDWNPRLALVVLQKYRFSLG